MQNPLQLKVKKMNYDGIIPSTPKEGNAGIDLQCPVPVSIFKGQVTKIDLQIALEIPTGYVGIIKDRSSLGSKGFHCLAGVIDNSYRGNICIVIKNLSDQRHDFERGDKIAQLLLIPIPNVEVIECTTLSNTERGDKGFGEMTGK